MFLNHTKKNEWRKQYTSRLLPESWRIIVRFTLYAKTHKSEHCEPNKFRQDAAQNMVAGGWCGFAEISSPAVRQIRDAICMVHRVLWDEEAANRKN